MDLTYLFRIISVKRLINLILTFISFFLSRLTGKPIVWNQPVTMLLEPTNKCNLKCPECPSGLGALTRNSGMLSMEDYKQYIDKASGTVFYLQLFFQGEPYLNKNLPGMIKYAAEKKIYTAVSTNGLVINEKNIDTIFDSAPDKIIFSIDGMDQDTYVKYRVGGSFEKAMNALKLVLKKKEESGNKKPFVEFQFIVMKQNEHQIDEVLKLRKLKGLNRVALKSMQISDIENAKEYLPSLKKYSRYLIKDGKPVIKNKLKNSCFYLWRTIALTWDGYSVPCCFDKDAKIKFGNLKSQELLEIWKGRKYYNFRKAILKGRSKIDMCRNCTEGLNLNLSDI